MSRRKESLVDLFIMLPWWVSLCTGALIYLVLAFVAPAFSSGDPVVGTLARMAPTFAPLVGFMFVALAIVSAVRSWSTGRNLEFQRDLESLAGLS